MSALSILVADDEATIRDALRIVLTKLGHRPVCVADGRKALAEMQTQSFDLIITDLLMPDCDGLELIGEVRRTHRATPIVAISGGGRIAGSDYLRMAKKLGARAILSKPFTADDVEAVIRSATAPPAV
jgi:CheY-like chemotaxis protein